jgi:hypothetical protein
MSKEEDVKNEIANIVNSTAELDRLVQLEMAGHLMAGAYNILMRIKVIALQKRAKAKPTVPKSLQKKVIGKQIGKA